MPDLITEEEGEAYRVEIAGLLAFQKSKGWEIFRAKVEEKRAAHIQGMANRQATPEKRAEHVEAYHDAVELLEWLPGRIKHLEEVVTRYNQQG